MGTTIFSYNDIRADTRLRASLRSRSGITNIGGVITGSPAFSPDGLLMAAEDKIHLSPPDHQDLNGGGQVVMTVQADHVADDTDTLCGGVDVGVDEYLLTWRNTAATIRGRIRRSSAGQYIPEFSVGDSQQVEIASALGKRFSRFNLVWDASTMRLYSDGNFLTERTRTLTAEADMMQEFWLASIATNPHSFRGLVRDFQLAADPVTLAVHENLDSVAVFGDSFASNGSFDDNLPAQTVEWDGAFTRGIKGYLNLVHGTDITFTAALGDGNGWGSGGAGVSDSHPLPLGPTLPACLASNPKGLLFVAGTNDINSTGSDQLASDFESSFTAMITSIMGTASLQWCKVLTVPFPYGSDVHRVNKTFTKVRKVNQIYRKVVSEWNEANPGRRGRLAIVDMHSAMPEGYNYFTGEIAGHGSSGANLHPSPLGNQRYADVLGPIVFSSAQGQGFESYNGPRGLASGGLAPKAGKRGKWRL